jgi:hypothetical protein
LDAPSRAQACDTLDRISWDSAGIEFLRSKGYVNAKHHSKNRVVTYSQILPTALSSRLQPSLAKFRFGNREPDNAIMRAGRQLSASRAMSDFLKKLDEDYDPTDKLGALRRLHESARRGEYATGRIYIEPDRDDFITPLNLVDDPQAARPFERACPGQIAPPDDIMEGLQ